MIRLAKFTYGLKVVQHLATKTLGFKFVNSQPPPSSTKYSKKTSKQIDREIAMQKFKSIQNTYKSLSTKFGLKKPSSEQLQKVGNKYESPKTIKYDLESLRICSKEYPIYLHFELQNKSSSFHLVIEACLENLWKADKKQTLQFIQFLYEWGYQKVDVFGLYQSVISRIDDIDTSDLFMILRKFYHSQNQQIPQYKQQVIQKEQISISNIVQMIQIKLLQKLKENAIRKQQFDSLMKILNLMAINNVLSPDFYYAVTNSIEKNINSISPQDSLAAYVFFTYNQEETPLNFQLHKQKQEKKQKSEQVPKIIDELLSILQKRVLAPECLKFYNSGQIIALLHTFLKNCILRGFDLENPNSSVKNYYLDVIQKICGRIQIIWVSADFSVDDKRNLLKLAPSLPFIKRQLIISLFHKWLLKTPEKVDRNLLVEIYLGSYEAYNLSPDIQKALQQKIVEQAFNISKQDVSRAAWLLTVTQASNMQGFLKKVEQIVLGGLKNKNYEIKEVAILVWAASASISNQNKQNKKKGIRTEQFWENMQDFFFEEITAKNKKFIQKQCSAQEIIGDISWIIWAYLNNKQLKLRTLDLITQTLIQLIEYGNSQPYELSPFQLTNMTSFYYTINYPIQAEPLIGRMKLICKNQFLNLYKQMECVELCWVLKFIGSEVWESHGFQLLALFDSQADTIIYSDVLGVMGLLINIETKTAIKLGSKLRKLLIKLNDRKNMLKSLQDSPTNSQ